MSQPVLSSESSQTLPPLSYKDAPVLTTELLAVAYEVEEHQIRQNFKNNRERFIEGKHYFSVAGEELAAFRLCVENFYPQISPKARTLTLWTERGAARHAKMLNSDKAWDVFELLEETFFAVARKEENPSPQTAGPDTPIGPADQNTLQAIVRAKVAQMPEASSRGGFPQIWTRFNDHFRLGSYKQLPQGKMAEAVEYLIKLEVREKKELPRSQAQFPSGIQSNIPGPQPGDRYYAYLERVEAWRVATIAERKKLYNEGIALLEVERMGREMFHVCADYLSLWLKDGVLSSNTSVFDELLSHNRAPVVLIKFLNTNFEDVRKYLK